MPTPDFVLALRRHIGNGLLWLPAVTAIIRRGDQMLMVRRADNGMWTPVTGIVDPGEEPAATAQREAREEACVDIQVDRLAAVGVGETVTYANGDQVQYLDFAFACTWVGGEAVVGDDESTAVRWFRRDALPVMPPRFIDRVDAAWSSEQRTRFRHEPKHD